MTDKTKIATRIRALLEKTVENGCTEEEAALAAAKANSMLQEYNLNLTELEVQSEKIGKRVQDTRQGKRMKAIHPLAYSIAYRVSELCNCKVWRSGKELIWFGTETDTEIAKHMCDMLVNIHDAEKKKWQKANPGQGKSGGHSFTMGMASRLNERLRAMIADNSFENEEVANRRGTDLVLVKNNRVIEAYKSLGMKLSSGAARASAKNYSGYSAGQAAGSRANISRGVGGSARVAIAAR